MSEIRFTDPLCSEYQQFVLDHLQDDASRTIERTNNDGAKETIRQAAYQVDEDLALVANQIMFRELTISGWASDRPASSLRSPKEYQVVLLDKQESTILDVNGFWRPASTESGRLVRAFPERAENLLAHLKDAKERGAMSPAKLSVR